MAKTITKIPATRGIYTRQPLTSEKRKRVAAYARVSTDSEEQLTSYEAQVAYYTDKIKRNRDWDFVKVYTDEGISATNTKNRDGFNTMISDALNGKIDLILTKSVSRFARNTVDSLTTVRKLKEKGIEVYFEKENIYTLDSKGELLITIMSSLAQEESRSISENVTWGWRRRLADGKVSMAYGSFLGYEKGEDGTPKIVESEARTVRLIYKLFLESKSQSYIADRLTEMGIPTPRKKRKWAASTVTSILKNEKYKGSALLQKTFTVDFLTKATKVNEGEVEQYYVEDSHPAIISKEIYDLAQAEFQKRKSSGHYKTSASCFSGKIFCGECGGLYGSKVWHSTSKYKRTIWQCNNKFMNDKKCGTPHLYESELRSAFVAVFNEVVENKAEVIAFVESMTETLMDTSKIDIKLEKAAAKAEEKAEILRRCVEMNSRMVLNQAEYRERFAKYSEEYERAENEKKELENQKTAMLNRIGQCRAFLNTLKKSDIITEFDEELFNAAVDKISVFDTRLVFSFKDGTEREYRRNT